MIWTRAVVDEEFRAYVDENVNLKYIFRYTPEEQMPRWLKKLKKRQFEL